MEMDTWYDLRIEQLFELSDRVSDLLDEVKDSGEDVVLRELLDVTDRVSELPKDARGDR